MLRVSNAVNERRQPFGSGISYDAGTGAFRDGNGDRVGDTAEAFAIFAEEDRGVAGPGAAGRTTLQRAALFAALLRGPAARRSLLERLRGVEGDGSAPARRGSPALDGVLYCQPVAEEVGFSGMTVNSPKLPPASSDSTPSSSETRPEPEAPPLRSCLMPNLWALQDNRPLYSAEPSEQPTSIGSMLPIDTPKLIPVAKWPF